VHLIPLLLIPVLIVLFFNARRWGLFADTPIDPEQRVAYWASQALTCIKVELANASVLSGEDQLLYRKDGRESRLWSEQGKLWRRRGAQEEAEIVAPVGSGGSVSFRPEGAILHILVEAREGDFGRELQASFPIQQES
jgi:hypothetical protein